MKHKLTWMDRMNRIETKSEIFQKSKPADAILRRPIVEPIVPFDAFIAKRKNHARD